MGPLVDTKLFVPPVRRGLVARPRLDSRLRSGEAARLTLVSAPAGFGKTTVLAAWSASSGRRAAWVSCDAADRRSGSFWAYVLAAIERAAPGAGAAALALLESGQTEIEPVLATAINELSVLPDDLDLVLDDYHLADGPEVRTGMTFFVEHLPPQVHLMISTRADPVLPLARLRARGELVELRAGDLRFTPAEAAAYLNDSSALGLHPADIDALEHRTEGWIAALQLAALSLRGRSDVARFINEFTGNDRFVMDYLVEEVLARQPEELRAFLFATSVLERLTGSLCDAVTGVSGGRVTLEALDRQNLFLVPLDAQRRWYRYHHLFADVLRAHLLRERPEDGPELHRRASRWYDDAGEPVPAVAHALNAGDRERAADLMERAIPALQRERREDVICGWLDTVPDDVVRRRPVLALGFVGALMASNQVAGVEDRLREIDSALEDPNTIVVDRLGYARLPAALEMYRAAAALTTGDLRGTIAHADTAAELAAGDGLTGGAASALSGLASWSSGDLSTAHVRYTAALAALERAGHLSDVLGCSITVADLEITLGRLRDAQRTFERALDLAGGTALRGIADMHVGLSRVACERNDLHAALAHAQRSDELGEQAGLPQNPYRWRVAMANLREAAGDLEGALALLDEAAALYVSDYSPNVRPVPAMRARVLATRGNLPEAWEWVRDSGLRTSDDPTYLREYDHLTLVRVVLAQHRVAASGPPLEEAAGLLDRLLEAAEAGGRTGSVIEVLALRALLGDDLDALGRALTLAEPHGYARVFLAEGAPMAALLRTLAGRRPRWAYVRRLLEPTLAPSAGPAPSLLDPLSDRELEVLRVLAGDLSGPEIARELVVSLNTVRTHTKRIYTKLGVDNRRSAVTTARRLGLLKTTTGLTT